MFLRLRAQLRRLLLKFFSRTVDADEGAVAISDRMACVYARTSELLNVSWASTPYAEFDEVPADQMSSPVFITGRFRSGSTLIWNIFRQLPQYTAFYEPFNERRWFLPHQRGSQVDVTHRNVADYWREYDGLHELSHWYNEQWTRRNLFMGPYDHDKHMKEYISMLIDAAVDRCCVQFNRVDFRLPWLRRQFPGARVLHVYRHPRQHWCSSLTHNDPFGPHDGTLRQFRRSDGFYLRTWIRDLQKNFPVLRDAWDEHPYAGCYLLWKLSYMFGRKYADWSLGLEEVAERPRETLEPVFGELGVDDIPWETVLNLVATNTRTKWNDYASPEWFRDIEVRCDLRLKRIYSADGLKRLMMNSTNGRTGWANSAC